MLSLWTTLALASGIPLREITYDVEVSGPLADIVVEQVFLNDSADWIEATYVFPLQQDAAVDEMSMVVGDREIVAVLRDREAAREAYETARSEGKAAALTEQERDNVFTQSVANIGPGEEIAVRIHVVQPVERVEGGYELVLPLVVGPRFVTAAVQDAARITPPVARAPTGVTVDIDVRLQAGLPLTLLESPTHDLGRAWSEGAAAEIALRNETPTRDFVLRWATGVDAPRSTALRQGSHVLVHFEPPEAPPRDDVVPRELIWVLDTSCSQSGVPLEMSKEAMARAFEGMDARDSFLVLNFSDTASAMAEAPLPATPENITFGRQYVEAYQAHGGTNMLAGVQLALNLPRDPDRERYVVFFTDGYIGDERHILSAIEDLRGDTKLFVFGLGSSVNRWLLDEMAVSGQGRATYVTLDESPELAIDRFLDTIDQPVLSDIAIDWGDWEVDEAYPARIPELVAGQPLDLVARVAGGSGPITVTGRLADRRIAVPLELEPVASDDVHAISSTWARRRIAALERQQHWGEVPELREEIVSTSLEYGVLTRYTAFVAVEQKVRNETGHTRRVEVPVDTPDGVIHDAAVSRTWTPPGDPLLTIDAAADSRAVIAVFPWGETAFLRFDPLRERWYHRFLVPRHVTDGPIDVVVFVHAADGTLERRTVPMVVDGEGPEVDVEAWVKDGRTYLRVYAEEPLRSIRAEAGRSLAGRDLREEDDAWVHELVLPGEHDVVEVVVKDRAMNTVVEVVSCRR